MKKWITGAVAAAALVAAGASVLPATEAAAQVPGFLTLEGPGSSIGVTVREATDEDRKRANLDQVSGVVIDSVRAGSPAERAGFRAGDIVLEFDGERVRSIRQFTRLVRETPPRRTTRAVVVRDTARQTLEVVPEVTGDFQTDARERLRQFDDDARGRRLLRDFALDVAPQLRRRGLFGGQTLGVTVSPVTGQLADYFGVKEGVLINSVESGSAAATAGLRAGDVITAVAGRSVRTAADIAEEVRRLQPGAGVDVTITRDRMSMTLKAVIPSAPQAPVSQGRGISL